MPEKMTDKELKQKIQSLEEEVRKYKKTAEERIESEQEFRTLYEEALNPIMVVDENGKYLRANQAALNFLECTLEGLEKKKVWDFTPPGHEERAKKGAFPLLQQEDR